MDFLEIRRMYNREYGAYSAFREEVNREYEATFMWCERIGDMLRDSRNPIDTLYDCSRGKIIEIDHTMPINTFPFGEPSERFKEFLGICSGNIALKSVFAAAKKHIEGNKKNEMGSVITIITDKWDASCFSRYEECFIEAAIEGVEFYFFLVTDYGISKIPFVHRNMIKELRTHSSIDLRRPASIMRKKYDSIRIEILYFSSFDIYKKYDKDQEFFIDISKNSIYKEGNEVSIDKRDLDRFLDELKNVLGEEGGYSTNYHRCIIYTMWHNQIMEKVEWCPEVEDNNPDSRFMRVAEALQRILNI